MMSCSLSSVLFGCSNMHLVADHDSGQPLVHLHLRGHCSLHNDSPWNLRQFHPRDSRKYDFIMQSVNELNIPVLVVFGLGCVIGILGFSKFLHWLLKRFERPTMLVLVGFVLGALVKVWPWNDMSKVAQAQLLRGGMDAEAAKAGADLLLSSGGNMGQVIDLQVSGAIIWAIVGLVLVAGLEYLSTLHKLKEAETMNRFYR